MSVVPMCAKTLLFAEEREKQGDFLELFEEGGISLHLSFRPFDSLNEKVIHHIEGGINAHFLDILLFVIEVLQHLETFSRCLLLL